MNKHIFLVLFTLLSAFSTEAQDTLRTLIKPKKITQIGLYVAPEYQYAQYNANEFTSTAGGSFMLSLNQKWAFGFTHAQTTDRSFSPSSVTPLYFRAGIRGFRAEWTPGGSKALHLAFPLVVGRGTAFADSTLDRRDRGPRVHEGRDDAAEHQNWTVIQPGLRLEANLLRYAKLFVGADYRFSIETGATTLTTVPDNALQGVSATVGLKIGLFDLPVKRSGKSIF